MKKLDILVPHYKEDFNTIKPLLDSIEIQQGVDLKNQVGVIIVNDGDDVIFDKNLFKNYTFTIKYYIKEHKGVSATRNSCLDYSNAEYIIYADSDDLFYNVCGLRIIFDEIERSHFDSMSSTFIQEQHYDNGDVKFLFRDDQSTFVHGKVHRRQYLIDNNIRWNEKLTIHEDSYFNCLCHNLSPNVVHAKTPFYLWKWRDNSVCRRDKKYLLKTYVDMIKSSTALVGQFVARRCVALSEFYATSAALDVYYELQRPEWLSGENKKYREKTEKAFGGFWYKYRDLVWNCDPEVKKKLATEIRARKVEQGMTFETLTFDQWINDIEEAYGM